MTNAVEWQSCYRKLAAEAVALEKLNHSLFKIDSLKEMRDTRSQGERSTLDKKRARRISLLKRSLCDIKNTMKRTEGSQPDLSCFYNLLESFESKLSLFKTQMAQEYESLVEQEGKLNREILALEERIGTWDMSGTSQLRSAPNDRDISQRLKHRNETLSVQQHTIGAIERKLAELGIRHHRGWDSRDHDVFLRNWTQIVAKNIDESPKVELSERQEIELERRLAASLSCKSADDIREHIQWYVKIQRLLAEKKEILSIWKRNKTRSNSEELGHVSSALIGDNENGTSSSGKNTEEIAWRKQQKKSRVQAWQKKKAEDEAHREAKVKLQHESSRREAEARLLERQQENKAMLNLWKEKKSKEKRNSEYASSNSQPRARSVDPAELRRRQADSIHNAKQKRQRVISHHQASRSRELKQDALAKRATLEVVGDRVESKLSQPTRAYLSHRLTSEDLNIKDRQRNEQSAHNRRVFSSGRDLQFTGRATPTWCQPGVFS